MGDGIKVLFTLSCEASPTDSKSNVRNVKSIQIIGEDQIYKFPGNLQLINLHPELAADPTIKKALQQLDKRGKCRSVKLTIAGNLRAIYVDPDENIQFRDEFLDSIPTTKEQSAIPNQPLQKSLSSLTKDMICPKFDRKSNPTQWIKQFELEVIRMNVPQVRFAEVLRLFLEGSALDWYEITFRLIGLGGTWDEWKINFLENFNTKGWSEIVYAYEFKYLYGSLSDYVLKKIRLLLEAEPALPTIACVNLVVVGLPSNVREKLDRSEILTQADLMSALGALEHLALKIPLSSDKQNKQMDINKKLNKKPEYKPCSICTKLGNLQRYHPETKCWNNPKNPDNKLYNNNSNNHNNKKNNIKMANNVELQEVMNEEIRNQKN